MDGYITGLRQGLLKVEKNTNFMSSNYFIHKHTSFEGTFNTKSATMTNFTVNDAFQSIP
jgi:hypothetical protein